MTEPGLALAERPGKQSRERIESALSDDNGSGKGAHSPVADEVHVSTCSSNDLDLRKSDRPLVGVESRSAERHTEKCREQKIVNRSPRSKEDVGRYARAAAR